MRNLTKISAIFSAVAFGAIALTSCEGSDIFEVDSPDWISSKVDSIAAAKAAASASEEEVLEGQMEDVYTVGATDYTSGFWSEFSKYYVIPDGEKWQAVINIHINPDDNTYYKNIFLCLTNDVDRGGDGYAEYGVWRYDATNDSATYNSQWGTYLYFKYTSCEPMMSPVDNADELLQSMNGNATITVDRSDPTCFKMSIDNGTIKKTYNQPFPLPSLLEGDTDIRCFIGLEGSYFDFVSTNIEPIGGCTSAEDKNPVSMVLNDVPKQISIGTPLDSLVTGITATVTFEEGVTKEVTAEDLTFSSIPDISTSGAKTLVAVYNKTFKGENADAAIMATAEFNVVLEVKSIAVTKAPTNTTYTAFETEPDDALSLAFDYSGIEITVTYADDSQLVAADLTNFTFGTVPTTAGEHEVTISLDGATTTQKVTVTSVAASKVTNSASSLGTSDCSAGWWTVFSDDFAVPSGETKYISLTNYTSGGGNWNNFVVILRKADLTEYAVVRADNYGWGTGYENNADLVTVGTQGDWATWLADMNGARVNIFVTNVGDGNVNILAIMHGVSGKTYSQSYSNIKVTDVNDVNFALTCDGSYYTFE